MSTAPHPHPETGDSLKGYVLAVLTYVIWGFLPLYMKALSAISPAEVVAHRVLWSIPIAGAILMVTRRTRDLVAALRSPRMLGMAAMTATLITANWMIYVYAIISGQTIQAALGYYINPLFSVALGAIVLREKLNRAQLVAIGLAATAVLILTVQEGRLPLLGLGLTVTWGLYALLKRQLPIGPNQGFMLEVLILSPAALACVIWLAARGDSHFGADPRITLLLMGCGVITAIPLMLYANAAKLLQLTTIAVLQYIAPTMVFLTAVLIFKEPFGTGERLAFPLIWAALLIYSIALLQRARRRPPPTAEPL
ncbi:EamA family transporter RarD [Paracoccus pacificus]|uniref:EamA family transporter RarD n=1 Tax=Paracoccus pacificus TaxID=1463598 RepID=A0ABW4RAB9_9RHOB